MTESANLTKITPSFITDAAGGVWNVVPSLSSGGQVFYNNSVQNNTANVVLLLYVNHQVYQQNAASNWFVWANGSWAASTDPRITESPSGTSVTTIGPAITDSKGVTWTLVSGSKGLSVAINSVTDQSSFNVALLYYANHSVFHQNTGNMWYIYQNSGWVSTSDPRATSPSITGITLSNSAFSGGAASATVIGALTVTMSSGSFSGTLALSGANAASFQLVGNTLATSGVVGAGSYSVTVMASQSSATFTKTLSLTGTSVSAGPQPPPQAVAAGFTNLVFSDDFNIPGTVAPNSTATSGYKWYPYSKITTADWSVNTTATAASIINGSGGPNASPNGGILSIHQTFKNANECLITVPTGLLGSGNYGPLGNGYWKHFYVEAYLQFAPGTFNGWPAFWSAGVDWWANSTHDELDFMECLSANHFSVTLHQWPANTATTMVNNHTVDANWHTYGFLWVPTGTGTGRMQAYFDNVAVGPSVNTGAGQTQSSCENGKGQELQLGGGVGWSMNADYVRVWQ